MTDEQPMADEPESARSKRNPPLSPQQQARADAEALRLGRHLPLGMVAGAAVGLLAGTLTHRFGICVPVGIAAGILLAGTLPVFWRRR